MIRVVVFTTFLVFVTAKSTSKRDASEFDNLPNPCGTGGRVYYPHPTDSTKFLQCTMDNKLMIVQCPMGEQWVQRSTACVSSVVVTTTPQTAAPTTVPTTTPTTAPTTPSGMRNPCINNPTNQILFNHPNDRNRYIVCDVFGRMFIMACADGQLFNPQDKKCEGNINPTSGPVTIRPDPNNPCSTSSTGTLPRPLYYALIGDTTKFIECDLLGHANILTCPGGLIWSQTQLSCVFPLGASGTGTVTGTATGTNPCTPQALATGVLFYVHPNKNKFYQCDLWGDVFVGTCPAGLAWNDNLKTCAGTFFSSNK